MSKTTAAAPSTNDEAPPKKPSTIEAIDALFANLNRSDAPGAVVGVAKDGRSIYRRAFGLASVALGVANMPTTRMRIGSTSKHFTCAAALLLAEEGKLDIDTSVRTYIPELPSTNEPTLRQLMNHISGLRDYLDVTFVGNGTAIQPAGSALAAQVRQKDVNFPTGEKFIYNNGGYHLLSICIERVAGMPFERFLQERLFDPLGMVDTVSVPSDLTIERGMATLHIPRASGGWRLGVFPSVEVRGEGAIVSTTDDMLRWLACVRTADTKVMSADSWRQLFETAHLVDGTPTHYALGLMLHPYRGVDVIHYAGGVMGGACQMLTVPQHGLDIVVITNGAPLDPSATASSIVDAVLGDSVLGERERIASSADYAPLLGSRYRGESSGLVLGFDEGAREDQKGQLGLKLLGNPPFPLRVDGDKLLLPTWVAALGPYELTLAPLGSAAAPQTLDIREGARSERYLRMPTEAPTVAAVAPKIVGNYHSSDADASANIELSADGGLLMKQQGSIGSTVYKLEPLDDVAVQVLPYDAEALPLMGALKLEHEAGKVTGFRMHTGRTRGVHFERVAAG